MNKNTLPIVLPSNVLSLTLTLIGFSSFAIPFSLAHPQLLVGTIVNAALFSAALFLPKKFVYPVIFLPGLAVLSRGLIFGPLTPFLIIMLPFIWVSNALLAFSFRSLINQRNNYWLVGLSAAILKTLFLFSSANILFKFNLVPKLFLTTMGSLQFITASLGCGAAFLIKKIVKSKI